MTSEELQREALLQQFQRKQALKQQYLRKTEPKTLSTLVERFYRHAILWAVDRKVDLFSLLKAQQFSSEGTTPLEVGLSTVEAVAALISRPAEVLFQDDPYNVRRMVTSLLILLQDCDNYQEVNGSGFTLPAFDYAIRLSETPHATLRFSEQAGTYRLYAEEPTKKLLPCPILLWEEQTGHLQLFMNRARVRYAKTEMLKEAATPIQAALRDLAGLLTDFSAMLREHPVEHPESFLRKQADNLEPELQGFSELNQVFYALNVSIQSEVLMLIRAAQAALRREILSPDAVFENLDEAIYLLSSAAELIQS